MRVSTKEIIAAVSVWAWSAAALSIPAIRDAASQICPRSMEEMQQLQDKLSATAKIYFPGSTEFVEASVRWSNLHAPTVNVVVVPGTEQDVSETIKFANKQNIPFLAYNGHHGATTTLGSMSYGIEIFLKQLKSIQIATDGKSVTVGGGINSKVVTDTLWAAGKQTVTGTCECVSYLGPALGGGHGWLQGHHGLLADQFLSMNVVLADGSIKTIDENSDLWWGMKGAGHNFGIVTSLTSKIYDIQHTNWSIVTFIFSGDKVEAVYEAANKFLPKNGKQATDVHNWSYWLRSSDLDPVNPVIIFYLIQEGVNAVNSAYSQAFYDIGPIVATPQTGTYRDLAKWTNIALDSQPCLDLGTNNPRFPIYLDSYNVAAQKKVYEAFAEVTSGSSAFNGSLFMFESYAVQGVQDISAASSAFAFRSESILAAPLLSYTPNGSALDEQATGFGTKLRNILHEATGRDVLRTYINYSFGDETEQEIYGSESWRQCRLKTLKKKYDPEGKFSFYAPVVHNEHE
ncbi:unnamed protein product [Clonostachys byssicola]|uniref:FAD-binding PCMH-type domain-containing protein n=1 Tax=Clonostachys byssicola TaxID=160290 RepID=A0A9N9YA89_9HYPO|nr:unnamed protein product [Clonostachys byssicola]